MVFLVASITDPWEHVAFGIVGGTLGYQFNEFDKRNRADLLVMMGAMDKFGKPGDKNVTHSEEEQEDDE